MQAGIDFHLGDILTITENRLSETHTAIDSQSRDVLIITEMPKRKKTIIKKYT